jgi:hypothetical protein
MMFRINFVALVTSVAPLGFFGLQGRLRARWCVCERKARCMPFPATTTSVDAVRLLGDVAKTHILSPVACPLALSAALVTSDPSELLLETPIR